MQQVRLGMAGHGFDQLTPEPFLELMTSRYGIRHLDYWPWNRAEQNLAEYSALLERFGVRVYTVNVLSAHGRWGIPGQTEGAMAALLQGIEEAHALGAEYVQFYTGVPARPEFLTVAKQLVRDLQPALAAAERRGVTLLLENNLDQRGEDLAGLNPSRRPELILAVMEEAATPHLKLCFDPTNFYTVGAEGFPYAYELLKPHIANVHLKDCIRYSPLLHTGSPWCGKLLTDTHGGSHICVPAGQGAVNWDGLFRRLSADGYEGWFTVDPFCAPEALLQWCDESIAYLQGRLDWGAHG